MSFCTSCSTQTGHFGDVKSQPGSLYTRIRVRWRFTVIFWPWAMSTFDRAHDFLFPFHCNCPYRVTFRDIASICWKCHIFSCSTCIWCSRWWCPPRTVIRIFGSRKLSYAVVCEIIMFSLARLDRTPADNGQTERPMTQGHSVASPLKICMKYNHFTLK